ncbi:MAG: Gfo/Idh/MocA family oxidoreductase [Oscillospiraceae bacterium]|nr:Gfo/Idh/MocA family oxidoreductase [Oscillospiraceae bacterium]
MTKQIRIGCIGLSGRGMCNMGEMLGIPGVVVSAVCDLYQDRADAGAKLVHEKSGTTPKVYLDHKQMLANENLDAVLCCTTWISHARIAVDCMRAGCHVALEVGGAASVEECWQMVRTSEDTGKFCMLLENCCYDRKEMALFNMVRQGVFGEVVHGEGGYRHDLRDEIAYGKENRHGRLPNFLARNGELYPTHQLGPIAKLMRINRGNQFLTLTSVASKARGLQDFILREKGADYYLANAHFACGDIVTTTIKCAGGETITLVHDCSLPRPYSRNYALSGTRACYREAPFNDAVYIDGRSPLHEWEQFDKYLPEFEHPLWQQYHDQAQHAGGHGGMDYLVLCAFVDAAVRGEKPPIDVYDTAAWMVVTCLSEQSVAMGGMPVPVPDFTNGLWVDREPAYDGKFCLEEVVA